MNELKILVQKDKLTTKGSLPSSQELYDLMSMVSCGDAVLKWKDHWAFCPVCLGCPDKDGQWGHYRVSH